MPHTSADMLAPRVLTPHPASMWLHGRLTVEDREWAEAVARLAVQNVEVRQLKTAWYRDPRGEMWMKLQGALGQAGFYRVLADNGREDLLADRPTPTQEVEKFCRTADCLARYEIRGVPAPHYNLLLHQEDLDKSTRDWVLVYTHDATCAILGWCHATEAREWRVWGRWLPQPTWVVHQGRLHAGVSLLDHLPPRGDIHA